MDTNDNTMPEEKKDEMAPVTETPATDAPASPAEETPAM